MTRRTYNVPRGWRGVSEREFAERSRSLVPCTGSDLEDGIRLVAAAALLRRVSAAHVARLIRDRMRTLQAARDERDERDCT